MEQGHTFQYYATYVVEGVVVFVVIVVVMVTISSSSTTFTESCIGLLDLCLNVYYFFYY